VVYVVLLADQKYDSQALTVCVEVLGWLRMRFNVIVESQPELFVSVVLYVPLELYVMPFVGHKYEPQALTFCVEEVA